MRISILNYKTYVHDSIKLSNEVINERIFNEELFDYRVVDREDLIDNLIMWISECGQNRQSDKYLMKEDLQYLMGIEDECIFSSISTNDYIVADDKEFEQTCNELLELNSFVEEVIDYMELHNNDEVGIDNLWNYEDAEYHLLLSDKYHTTNEKV